MSPASRSKSKDKKAVKEVQKTSSKLTISANAVTGTPASAYNPLLGTFHTLETVPMSATSHIHGNGRFRNIDETDENHGGSLGNGFEYDSVSNNGSWSGESEDLKDKASNPSAKQEIVPGADNDKREKTRQKNERKHQRQKERRAQELHEKCTGYLMSRKLEALAQQLVAMGFSQERSTMALILNEGRVEESVAWLLSEDSDSHRDQDIGKSSLKLDISEELARIADMEIRYKCSKQEVERVIVSCEGDLEKAAKTLKTQKHDPPSAPPKTEENGEPQNATNGKLSVAVNQNTVRQLAKSQAISSAQQLRRDDRDFNYTRAPVSSSSLVAPLAPGNKNVQPSKRTQPKVEWSKPQQTAVPSEKRWPNAGSSLPVSYSAGSSGQDHQDHRVYTASPLQASPPLAKPDTRYMTAGNEFKNLQPGSVREPVIVMQRPQSIPQSVNTKQIPVTSTSSSPSATAASWYPTSSTAEITRVNELLNNFTSSRILNQNNLSSNQINKLSYRQQHFVPGSGSGDSLGTSRGNSTWSRTGSTPTLAVAASLGLFSGLGSTGSSGATSPIDWSMDVSSMPNLDYNNVDWSLNRGLSSASSSRPTGFSLGLASFTKNSSHMYGSNANGMGPKLAMRPATPNGNGVSIAGLHDGVPNSDPSSAEWTSPFEEKDLFSLPRQFVFSPSL